MMMTWTGWDEDVAAVPSLGMASSCALSPCELHTWDIGNDQGLPGLLSC